MPSLLDHIDRFSYTAKVIQSAALQTSAAAVGSPYVRAVLNTPLGDLARDVDASELGLFTLVPQSSVHAHVAASASTVDDLDASVVHKSEVARVEFPGATPLRRPPATQRGIQLEKEPEVYAEAALRYLDRYQSIRPMPRARQEVESIIERLNVLRNEISQLSAAADQSDETGAAAVPTARDEEKRINELNLRIKQMKARKEVLIRRQKPPQFGKPAISKASTAKDKEEANFWSEPVPRKRPSRARQSLLIPAAGAAGADDSLLLDAHMGAEMGTMGMLGDVSMDSLAGAPTPLPAPREPAAVRRSEEKSVLPRANTKRPIDPALVPLPSPSPSPSAAPSPSPSPPPEVQQLDKPDIIEEEEEEVGEERTVMLTKPPRIATPTLPPSSPPRPANALPAAAPSTPPRESSDTGTVPVTPGPTSGVTATPGTNRKSRMKITTDVERIVAKIWSTVGDIIMPGHPFNTAAAAATNKPPRAKETIALLQNLSTQTPPPGSPAPSHSTFSLTSAGSADPSQPTAHQILTANLLLALLAAVPKHAMPLAQAKATLAAVGIGASGVSPSPLVSNLGLMGGGQALETRALYGCVAKRLLKIDRNGKEQIVRFDV
ncbi:hypothetical protein M0805_006327 [Coniferiporia weirii]|nr:hypothetical protein M0805_006327 [Coniferiporia weirii]